MKIIVITRPDFFDGETELVNNLFRAGMERLHLRKPKSSEEELASWLQNIDSQYYGRIVLHDHFNLISRFPLGGVHLNSRNPEYHKTGSEQDITISRSCHSIAEVIQYKPECNYLFLSPIYDSISKEGYGAAFSRIDLKQAADEGIIDSKVLALGGVSLEHIPELRSMGFGGAAVLGALWQAKSPTEYLKALMDALG